MIEYLIALGASSKDIEEVIEKTSKAQAEIYSKHAKSQFRNDLIYVAIQCSLVGLWCLMMYFILR